MTQPSMSPRSPQIEAIALQHPAVLSAYGRYAEAQRAVDYLSDQEFPVQNCMIVGTDLRQVERVTGRMTQMKAALGGLASGAWLGLFVGLIMSMFDGQGMQTVVTTVLFGALFGVVWALLGYAMTRGRRDFTSVSAVVATRYEVLVEHGLLQQARHILGGLPNNGLVRPAAPARPVVDAPAPQQSPASSEAVTTQPPAAPAQPGLPPAPWQAGGATRAPRDDDPQA